MTAGLGIVFVLLRNFEQLADAFVTAFLPFYALAVASIFRLRKKPGYAPTFRVPLYPVLPIVFLASVLYLLGNAIVAAREPLVDARRPRRRGGGDPGLLPDRGAKAERRRVTSVTGTSR